MYTRECARQSLSFVLGCFGADGFGAHAGFCLRLGVGGEVSEALADRGAGNTRKSGFYIERGLDGVRMGWQCMH